MKEGLENVCVGNCHMIMRASVAQILTYWIELTCDPPVHEFQELGNLFCSMPEEDEEFQDPSMNDSQDSSKTKWTPVTVNSHLHHSRTSPTGPMADLRLSGKKRSVGTGCL